MSLHKRGASDAGQPTAKSGRIKTSDSQPDQEIAMSTDLPEACGDFKIEVKLRSKSKAARNDPELTIPQRELYQKVLLEKSNGGPPTLEHRFAASLAVHGPSLDPGQDQSDDEPQPTPDIEHVDRSQRDDLVLSQRGEQSKSNAENENDDDQDDDDKGEMDFEGDYYEDNSEDECRSEYDVDFEFKWLEPIDVKAISTSRLDEDGKPMRAGYCNAKLIRRGQMRDDFYGEMEQPSRETSMLAFDLFDRYGRLRSEFKTHPIIKGTGIWGQELDGGDILLIEKVFVKNEHRRQGLGRKMIESLLTLAREKTWSFFAFAWPTVLRLHDFSQEYDSLVEEAERDRLEEREHDRAVMFHRSLGFRRVGSTIWFALTPDVDHPSRQLSSMEDFNPSEAPPTSLHCLLSPLQQISDPPPSGFDRIRNPQPRESPDFLSVLQNCMQQNGLADACWETKDKHGNTVLHLAASILSVACIEWILTQGIGARLLEMRNNRGETPLELLQFKLEKLRTQKVFNDLTVPVSDEFEGYNDSAVRCLILLKGLGSVESITELQGPDALLQIVGGCTCGQCLKGFLSPRMSYALLCQAEIGHDMMDEGISQLPGPDWVEGHMHNLGGLPSKVLNNLKTNKSMRQGFVNLWLHIATCLKSRTVPTAPNVLDMVEDAGEWPPATKHYLQRGGTVEPVFLAVCRNAIEQDKWAGDGNHEEIFSNEISKLPECRNDHEFAYVSGMCGYERISLRGTVDMMGNGWDEVRNIFDLLI
ncbi:hypothetical protein LTR84_005677 [Exophiala bonariae]|uniref:N-acetyltransferase domain-containing protein n=1 Tax=Exophiala bonariae TaxID=1690606 RepID=A0AAV9N2Z2_9EURO|nr:hypothetical protein LTR84_005677 [Exophiala bonariae]